MSTTASILPGRLLILLTALAAIFLLLSGSVAASAPSITVEHRVRAGDTLWVIASELTAPGEDVRATVELIRDINDLETSGLQTGQVLLIPAG
jgi:nucleoid-associated protein YgaU